MFLVLDGSGGGGIMSGETCLGTFEGTLYSTPFISMYLKKEGNKNEKEGKKSGAWENQEGK